MRILRKDEPLIYSVIYRNGKDGPLYAKRFLIGGVTRDKEYDITKGQPGTRIVYFATHVLASDSDDQLLQIHLKPHLRLRNVMRPFHFAQIAVKGRSATGLLVTKHAVDRITRAAKDKNEPESNPADQP